MTSPASDERWVLAPTIPVRFAREMLSRSGVRGTKLDAVLLRAGLFRNALRMRRFRLSALQFDRLYRAVIAATGDECFGYFARPVPPGAYLTMVRMLTHFSHVGACLDGSGSFYRLFDPHDFWRMSVGPRQVRLEVRPRTKAHARSIFFVQVMLISPWRTMCWLTGQPWPLLGVTLDPRFASFAAEARFLFGCEPAFATDRAEIRFSAEVLGYPIVRRAEDVRAYGTSSLLDMIAAAPRATLEGQIRAVLGSSTPLATAGAEEVAQALAMSSSTLSRRLKKLGLTFQALKDDVRRDRAIALLSGSRRSIADIAADVGYSEASAFQRAFKTWTGVAPGRYRKA